MKENLPNEITSSRKVPPSSAWPTSTTPNSRILINRPRLPCIAVSTSLIITRALGSRRDANQRQVRAKGNQSSTATDLETRKTIYTGRFISDIFGIKGSRFLSQVKEFGGFAGPEEDLSSNSRNRKCAEVREPSLGIENPLV